MLESFVSQYQNHFDLSRSTEEDPSNEDFKIAVNGPDLAPCEGVVEEAINKYWKDKFQ